MAHQGVSAPCPVSHVALVRWDTGQGLSASDTEGSCYQGVVREQSFPGADHLERDRAKQADPMILIGRKRRRAGGLHVGAQ